MRRTLIIAATLCGCFCCGIVAVAAQDASELQAKAAQKTVTPYRLDFSLNEIEDGKKINTRHYSMNITDDSNPQNLKIGTRVPVESDGGKFEYLDVGTSIHARMINAKSPLGIDVTADISNFAVPGEAGRHALLRQMIISGSSVVVTDKPILIGSVDDPNSKREYQLEVLVTRLK